MFCEDKIIQIVGYLLSLNGKRMDLLKLMKELYLIDRESINERGTSLSGDTHFSLPHGPVLSMTLNLLNSVNRITKWHSYMHSEEVGGYYPDIILDVNTLDDRLSEKDKGYIETISSKFKNFEAKELENYTHNNLDEWKDPAGSSEKITFADIMRALGKTENETLESQEEYNFINSVFNNIGCKPWI